VFYSCCADFFDKNKESIRQLSNLLSCIDDETIALWETQTANQFSPGTIDNEEFLLRALDNPTHWDRNTNQFTPNAFLDAGSFGLSVNRIEFATIEELINSAEQRINQKNSQQLHSKRVFIGFAKYKCGEIRDALSITNKRLLAVFDTANPKNVSHADVFFLVKDEILKRRARSILFEKGNEALINKHGNHVDDVKELSKFIEV
jgi:hypothetical protein